MLLAQLVVPFPCQDIDDDINANPCYGKQTHIEADQEKQYHNGYALDCLEYKKRDFLHIEVHDVAQVIVHPLPQVGAVHPRYLLIADLQHLLETILFRSHK